MRHRINARVRRSKVIQAAAATALRDTEERVNDAKGREESYSPIIRLGQSKISRLMVKQNEHGTGSPEGLRSTQWEYTD